MARWLCGVALTCTGSATVAIVVVAAVAPIFGFAPTAANRVFLIAAIGLLLLLAGWMFLPAPKPPRTTPFLLIMMWTGTGLALGTIRGNALRELSLLNWSAVLIGAMLAGSAMWCLRRPRGERA
jgi:hypothetical protein